MASIERLQTSDCANPTVELFFRLGGTLIAVAVLGCQTFEAVTAPPAPRRRGASDTLALMNGTSAMTGLGGLDFDRALKLAALAATVTAMVSDVIHGNPEHFSERIFEFKPHPGSIQAAAWIRDHLASAPDRTPERLQDRYSIRCAPHVIGVLLDTLTTTRKTLEIELNSANDNPLLDLENGVVLHGGNFHGAHVCAVMDSLKAAIASVADLLDRQLVLICTP